MADGSGVILIGGTSHVGKSTLAEQLARKLGAQQLSTDSLARHPGRPWKPQGKEVPAHVAEHYLSLEVEELIQDVLAHYRRNVWPLVQARIDEHLGSCEPGRLILEGSALWPDSIVSLSSSQVRPLLLRAPAELLTERILANSGHPTRPARQKRMIEKFLARTLEYDRRMTAAARRLGLEPLEVRPEETPQQLLQRCMEVLGLAGSESEQILDRTDHQDRAGQADDHLNDPGEDRR